MTRLTKEQCQAVIEYYKQGFSLRECSEEFGISYERIRYVLRRFAPPGTIRRKGWRGKRIAQLQPIEEHPRRDRVIMLSLRYQQRMSKQSC